MKSPVRIPLAVLAVALTATTLTACNGGGKPHPSTPAPVQPSTSATPTPSPKKTSDEDLATQKVIEAIRLTDEVAQRLPGRTIDDLATVARGTMLDGWDRLYAGFLADNWTQHGYKKVTPISSVLSSGGVVLVKVCEDSREATVVDEQGKNVRPTDSPVPLVGAYLFDVTKAPEGFFVTDGRNAGEC